MTSSFNLKDKLEDDVLDLSLMNIEEVPLKEISKLTRVRTLDLSNNQLRSLPANFGSSLSHIVKLDLSANKLESLPKTFHQLTSLKHLDLYNNKLTDLPESLHHLKNLRFLDLKNNPLNPELSKVVGPCLDHGECESAAKKVVSHFNKQKKKAIEEHKQVVSKPATKMKDTKQRADDKKVNNKKEKKTDNKQQKQQQQQSAKEQQNSQQQKSNGKKNAPKKQPTKPVKSSGFCSSLVSWLMVATLLGLVAMCVHVHVEGDYSQAGFKAAVPRVQKNLFRLRNMTAEAFQPENLKRTGSVVLKTVTTGAVTAKESVKRGAYATQDYIEVYTGDLTPFTSQVSKYFFIASDWVCGQTCKVCDWLSKQDWQGMYDTVATFLLSVWSKVVSLWQQFISHPSVKQALAVATEYLRHVLAMLQELFASVIKYLGTNGPIWIETVKETSYILYTNAKSSIESAFK